MVDDAAVAAMVKLEIAKAVLLMSVRVPTAKSVTRIRQLAETLFGTVHAYVQLGPACA